MREGNVKIEEILSNVEKVIIGKRSQLLILLKGLLLEAIY